MKKYNFNNSYNNFKVQKLTAGEAMSLVNE